MPTTAISAETRTFMRAFAWRWLALGLLAVVLLPAARTTHAWIGWLPFWLVCAPMLVLAQLGDAKQLVIALARRARPRRMQARRFR
ncbi:MAG TPA: hypothetical protein VFL14_14565 [Xanthomonadales bacterium]|nr:hypothetical protein [Xanthomonadales bacterium]